jgi:hypothetical protein
MNQKYTDEEKIRRLILMSNHLGKGNSDLGDFLKECANRITEGHLLERVVAVCLGAEYDSVTSFGDFLDRVRKLK